MLFICDYKMKIMLLKDCNMIGSQWSIYTYILLKKCFIVVKKKNEQPNNFYHRAKIAKFSLNVQLYNLKMNIKI